jgi:hypothetical protein
MPDRYCVRSRLLSADFPSHFADTALSQTKTLRFAPSTNPSVRPPSLSCSSTRPFSPLSQVEPFETLAIGLQSSFSTTATLSRRRSRNYRRGWGRTFSHRRHSVHSSLVWRSSAEQGRLRRRSIDSVIGWRGNACCTSASCQDQRPGERRDEQFEREKKGKEEEEKK